MNFQCISKRSFRQIPRGILENIVGEVPTRIARGIPRKKIRGNSWISRGLIWGIIRWILKRIPTGLSREILRGFLKRVADELSEKERNPKEKFQKEFPEKVS